MALGWVSAGVLAALLLRALVAIAPYSGANTPPKFGDYECQRHWMEITYHLPIRQWYFEGPDNDLSWWGLDYPPLTAYWSLAFGHLAQYINPEFVALQTSRGLESQSLKTFMRSSVLIGDLLVYFPAILLFVAIFYRDEPLKFKLIAAATMAFQPALIMIDHGHFQYNSVSLGLTLAAAAVICAPDKSGRLDLLGSVLFTMSFNYKQMSLYFALPFFAMLLGKALELPTWRERILRIALLGVSVISTCVILWWPWLDQDGLQQMARRIFPVGRGLFEDKVGNVWCSISPVIKLKELYSVEFLARMCAIVTIIASAPKCIYCLRHPEPRVFVETLFNTSIAFYLFSFHVHEKSALLPALPACMLVLLYPLPVFVFNIMSCFSMYPLLKREGLALQYFAVMILFMLVSAQLVRSQQTPLTRGMLFLSLCGAVLVHAADAMIAPPPNLPDLWTLLMTTYACGHFCLLYIASTLPLPREKIKTS